MFLAVVLLYVDLTVTGDHGSIEWCKTVWIGVVETWTVRLRLHLSWVLPRRQFLTSSEHHYALYLEFQEIDNQAKELGINIVNLKDSFCNRGKERGICCAVRTHWGKYKTLSPGLDVVMSRSPQATETWDTKSHESTTRMWSSCLQFDGVHSPIEVMVLSENIGSRVWSCTMSTDMIQTNCEVEGRRGWQCQLKETMAVPRVPWL